MSEHFFEDFHCIGIGATLKVAADRETDTTFKGHLLNALKSLITLEQELLGLRALFDETYCNSEEVIDE